MECEICGSPEAGYIILVEGAKLSVCRDCSSSGKLLKAPSPPQVKGSENVSRGKEELEIVDGYGSVIANARKKMGLSLEVLAEKLNEKHSFLERVEHEKTLPDERLAHKLEKELGIKLLASAVTGASAATGSGKGGMTLGDILEIQTKKKKE
jgi:putative transcription factor